MCSDNLPVNHIDFNDTEPRNWATRAMIILQIAAEDYMQEVFASAVQLTAVSSSMTILPWDIHLAHLEKQSTLHGNNPALTDAMKLYIPIPEPAQRTELENPGILDFYDYLGRPQVASLFA